MRIFHKKHKKKTDFFKNQPNIQYLNIVHNPIHLETVIDNPNISNRYMTNFIIYHNACKK